jgi:hypothetical protein
MTLPPMRRSADGDVVAGILDGWRQAGEHATGRRFPDRGVLAYINRLPFLDARQKQTLARKVLAEKSTPARRGIEQRIETQRRVWRLKRQPQLTLEEAREILTWCNSYERLPSVIRMYWKMDRSAWLTLLGQEWEDVDNVGRYLAIVAEALPDHTVPEMMTEAERAALAALPEVVTIYRGADRGVNEAGFCWSLDRDVAARFPFYRRYHAADPVLVTATVPRDRIIALKLERHEREVITKGAEVISVESVARPADMEDGLTVAGAPDGPTDPRIH